MRLSVAGRVEDADGDGEAVAETVAKVVEDGGSVGEEVTDGVEAGVNVDDGVGVDVGGSAKRDGVRLGVSDGEAVGVAEASIRDCA